MKRSPAQEWAGDFFDECVKKLCAVLQKSCVSVEKIISVNFDSN